jgi:phosphoribosyl 1,2-cyclic phosphodiesterase
MRITFYGTRGSIPVCSPEHQEFGGNTTCILVEGQDSLSILDAGTGIRALGKQWADDPRLGIDSPVFIAFSHFHWDHIQGLPFFKPAYDSQRHFIISAIGRERHGKDLKSIFELQMRHEYFPVPLEGMEGIVDYQLPAEDTLELDTATVIATSTAIPAMPIPTGSRAGTARCWSSVPTSSMVTASTPGSSSLPQVLIC